jgi:ferrous iron transport protein A
MNTDTLPLAHLSHNKLAKIIKIEGGHGLHNKLRVLGIREGELIRIVSKQPLFGPITVAVSGSQITIGRGMAHKIIVEVK